MAGDKADATLSVVSSDAHNSRRGSVASQTSKSAEKDPLSQALDQIHIAASRSDTFTSFDFAAPHQLSSNGDARGRAGDLVSGGLTGLYNRLRATVGVSNTTPTSPTNDVPDDASGSSSKANIAIAISPVDVSSPSPRLVSPA